MDFGALCVQWQINDRQLISPESPAAAKCVSLIPFFAQSEEESPSVVTELTLAGFGAQVNMYCCPVTSCFGPALIHMTQIPFTL